MSVQPPEKLTKPPAIPKQFGDDGGKFYKYYDELADELDEDMVTSLKSQLDGVLIFAGLFAGVNSAFLAFTLPQMSASPADDTNALLFQIMLGANGTITSPADLPSASFSPPAIALPINILFSMSLTLALLASFLAVLGQQWLVYYRKRSGGGPEYQRWEQLRRYLGAKRWRLELVLDDVLPSVIQIALVIFCVAFILYLGTLSSTLCYAIIAPLSVAGALISAMAISSAWDRWCPFKSPLSHLIQPILQPAIGYIGRVVAVPAAYVSTTFKWVSHRFRSRGATFLMDFDPEETGGFIQAIGLMDVAWCRSLALANWFKIHSQRIAEASDSLKLFAFKRVLQASEDSAALIHASMNATAITDQALIREVILGDEEFRSRFETLNRLPARFDSPTSELVQDWALAFSWFHVAFTAGSVEDFLCHNDRLLRESRGNDDDRVIELTDKLNRMFFSLNFSMRDPILKEWAESCHSAILVSSITVVSMIACPLGEMEAVAGGRDLDEPTPVSGDSRSFGATWIKAWGIKISKDRHSLHRDTLGYWSFGERVWALERLRDFLLTYQNIGLQKCIEILNDGVTASGHHWPCRPGHDVFVTLLKRSLTLWRDSDSPLASTLKAVLTLLRSIESRIRDPATSAEERQLEREYRKTCIEAWISTLDERYRFNSMGSEPPDDVLLFYGGPFGFDCVEASSSLQEYLQWMKDIIDSDPSSADNTSLMRFATHLCSRLPHSDGIVSQNLEVDWRAKELGWSEEDKTQAYHQLYSFVTETVNKIKATISPVPHLESEGETAGSHLEQAALRTESKSSRISFEWWGN